MKKLLTLTTLALTLAFAHADPPTYATDMAIYQEIPPSKPAYYYFYARWHNIKFGHLYQLQYSVDATHWFFLTDIVNECCPGLDIWVQQTPIIEHPTALFRVQEM